MWHEVLFVASLVLILGGVVALGWAYTKSGPSGPPPPPDYQPRRKAE